MGVAQTPQGTAAHASRASVAAAPYSLMSTVYHLRLPPPVPIRSRNRKLPPWPACPMYIPKHHFEHQNSRTAFGFNHDGMLNSPVRRTAVKARYLDWRMEKEDDLVAKAEAAMRHQASAFAAADLSADGVLDLADFRVLCANELREPISRARAKQIFLALDSDDDGTLSIGEWFLFALEEVIKRVGVTGGLASFLARWDKSGDKMLSREEVRRMASRLGFAGADDEILAKFDADGSGDISLHELMRAFNKPRDHSVLSVERKRAAECRTAFFYSTFATWQHREADATKGYTAAVEVALIAPAPARRPSPPLRLDACGSSGDVKQRIPRAKSAAELIGSRQPRSTLAVATPHPEGNTQRSTARAAPPRKATTVLQSTTMTTTSGPGTGHGIGRRGAAEVPVMPADHAADLLV